MKKNPSTTTSGHLLTRTCRTLPAVAMAVLIAGCGSMGTGMGPSGQVSLSGANEVPAIVTTATGSGMIRVASDHTVSGSISTTGIDGKAAHIHMAQKGSNGPVVLPLTKVADGSWIVPEGAKLSDAQYASYIAGDMYVNVHSAANPAGEIRGQLRPN
ncbi:MAG: CHRD domain-containing protein [Herminiimonas sp.]|nr:CHRD domain-containing protein [Herminiimonas sp.]